MNNIIFSCTLFDSDLFNYLNKYINFMLDFISLEFMGLFVLSTIVVFGFNYILESSKNFLDIN